MRLEAFCEGLCAQVLHVGPFSAEGPVIEALHAFIAEQGGRLVGKHHEIYLSDPRRTAPERIRTIIRQPFVESEGELRETTDAEPGALRKADAMPSHGPQADRPRRDKNRRVVIDPHARGGWVIRAEQREEIARRASRAEAEAAVERDQYDVVVRDAYHRPIAP